MQAKSRAFATEQIDLQRYEFKRLGVLADWDHPYRTMDFKNEAEEIRAFKRVVERGFVYRGLKPVYWCFDCGSSWPSSRFNTPTKNRRRWTLASCALSLPSWPAPRLSGIEKDAFVVIWTTTAWTIPANQALNLNPEIVLRAGRHRARPAGAGRRAGREVHGTLPADRHRAGHDRRQKPGRYQSSEAPRSPMWTRATTA